VEKIETTGELDEETDKQLALAISQFIRKLHQPAQLTKQEAAPLSEFERAAKELGIDRKSDA